MGILYHRSVRAKYGSGGPGGYPLGAFSTISSPTKLLDHGIVLAYMYDMQSHRSPTGLKDSGLLFDNRHADTKSDWGMRTVTTYATGTRRPLADTIAYWLNDPAADQPFIDLFNTVDGGYFPNDARGNPILFQAKPVQERQFALLALGKEERDELSPIWEPDQQSHGSSVDERRAASTTSSTNSYPRTTGPSEPPTVTLVPINYGRWWRDAGLR